MLKKIRDSISRGLIHLIDENLDDLPENADRFLRLAKLKHGTGDFSGAVESATSAIRNDPNIGEAYYWRCRAQYDLGNTTQALHDALRDAKLRANNTPTLYMLGNIFLRIENYTEACEAYTRAIDLGDTNPVVYVGRGYANYGLESHHDALDDLLTAENLGYDNATLAPYIDELKRRAKNGG